MASLLVVLSYHGYGHIAQTAPVVNELVRRRPRLRVTLQCAAPPAVLAEHFWVPFAHLPQAADFGMEMASSLDVLVPESHARYLALHADWEREVEVYAARLRAHAPDLLLANVPYLPLAAARQAGVRAVALCSLNWAEIYRSYCAGREGAEAVYAQMLAAYRAAELFLVPQPGMDMPQLGNCRRIGPISRRGRNRRQELDRILGLEPGHRLVLLFLGGVRTELPVARWPRRRGLTLLVPAALAPGRPDLVPIERLGMPYIDVLASSDALITKPGYGGFAEAACHGVPVLYVQREGWPEAPYLVRWLTRHGRCAQLDRSSLEAGDILPALEAVWARPPPAAVAPSGIEEAAGLLEAMLPA